MKLFIHFRISQKLYLKKISIDNDVIDSSAKVLASIGRLSGDQLKAATAAAADLSAGLGIGLDEAANRLARSAEGVEAPFKRLGFQFTKGATDAQIFQETLAQVQQRFGGLAETIAANTFEGVFNRLQVAFKDAEQALGDFVVKSPVVREILKITAEAFENITNFLKSAEGIDFLDNAIIQTVQFAQAVNENLIKPIEIFANISKTVVDGFIIAFQGAIAGIGQFGGAIGDLLSKLGVDNGLTQFLSTFRDSSAAVFQDATANFQGFKDVLSTPVADSISPVLDNLNQRLVAVQGNVLDTVAAVDIASTQIVAKLSAAAIQINQIYQQGILKSISSAAQALGASLIRGGAAFDDFKNVVLGIIGDMAIQIGSTLVGIGIGIENLKLALATLTGGAAIAAGLALIALGGALKALSGGGISAGASGGGAVAGADISSPDFNGGSSPVSDSTKERTPQGSLVVNLNGDILGDENSGKRLVDILNTAFDASGISLRQGII